MKKFLAIFLAIILFTGIYIKGRYDRYSATHLPGNAVVYYADGEAAIHIDSNCKYLCGPGISKTTFSKVRFSSYLDMLCNECVPPQYER